MRLPFVTFWSWIAFLGFMMLLSTACANSGPDAQTVITTEQTVGQPDRTAGGGEEAAVEPGESVAVLFVGHGEPATHSDGDIAITFADDTVFGPHAVSLGVPAELQFTEWSAAYDEIATAMTYIFPDLNGNGVPHEIMISPQGDVPPFFTWEAFHESVVEIYEAFGDYSPHNDLLAEHVANLDIEIPGVQVDTYLAFLDALPRIPDVMGELSNDYDKVVVVPMLLSSSTHTREVQEQVEQATLVTGGMDFVVVEPFFEVPFMKARVMDAVVGMAEYVRQSVPAGIADEDIGVLLVAHGTPYVPALPEFGWQEGEIFSNLLLTESVFHEEIARELPWTIRTGRMNYASPTIEESLAALEADGMSDVMVIPSAFPTASMHTMWDVPSPAVGRAVTPDEGVVVHTRPSGTKVYYSADGYADLEPGRQEFRAGLAFIAKIGVLELFETDPAAQS